jgi:hypothetical protein
MKAYDEIWGVAEDNFGVITSAKATSVEFLRRQLLRLFQTFDTLRG